MNKKLCSTVLTCSIMLGLLPMTAFAATTPVEIKDTAMDFRNVTTDSSNATEGWDWDAESKTLTLEDFNGTVASGIREGSSAILLPKESTVTLKGKNNEITSNAYNCNGIYADGNLYIDGNGTLKITIDSMSASGVRVNKGGIFFEDKADVNIVSKKYALYVYDAKADQLAVSVTDDARVLFPTTLTEDAVYVVKEKNVDNSRILFDYDEAYDTFDDATVLTKADEKSAETPEEKPEETPTETPEVPATKPSTYKIVIGDKKILKDDTVVYQADVAPYLSKGYTMLPLRALLVVSDPNVTINWDAPSKTATINYNGKTFSVVANASNMKKDKASVAMVTPAEVSGGRLFISLRDWMNIMELQGDMVSWSSKDKTVTLLK